MKAAQGLSYRRIDIAGVTATRCERLKEDVSETVGLSDRLENPPCWGSIEAWMGDDTMLCDVRAMAQNSRRGARQFAYGSAPVYAVLLVCQGNLRYQDGGRQTLLRPGDILIENINAQCRLVTNQHRTLQLVLPNVSRMAALSWSLQGCCLPRNHPATGMLRRQLVAMRERVWNLSCKDLWHYQEVVQALLCSAMSSEVNSQPHFSKLHRTLRAEIIRYLQANLSEPWLNVCHLSHHFQMSRTQLYRLFRAEGGAAVLLQYMRLCQAAKEVQQSQNDTLDIETLANKFGFSSVKMLEETFRETFDIPLKGLRQEDSEPLSMLEDDPQEQLLGRLPGAFDGLQASVEGAPN